jgi:hypothetical protein
VPDSRQLDEKKRDRQRQGAELLGRSRVRAHDLQASAEAEEVVERILAT